MIPTPIILELSLAQGEISQPSTDSSFPGPSASTWEAPWWSRSLCTSYSAQVPPLPHTISP